MATVTEMRTWLRDQGHEVPERGRLTADWKQLYDTAHPAGPSGTDDPDWDLQDTEDETLGGETEPDVPMQPERPPRTARSGRRERRSAQTRSDRLVGKLLGGTPKDKDAKAKAKPKTRHRRVSVDHLVGRAWEGLARFTAPVSLPVSRCLQVQSPVAGMILEEIIAGTMADRILQPVARAEEKAEKVLALVGPPVLVLALEQAALLPPEQAAMRQAII